MKKEITGRPQKERERGGGERETYRQKIARGTTREDTSFSCFNSDQGKRKSEEMWREVFGKVRK